MDQIVAELMHEGAGEAFLAVPAVSHVLVGLLSEIEDLLFDCLVEVEGKFGFGLHFYDSFLLNSKGIDNEYRLHSAGNYHTLSLVVHTARLAGSGLGLPVTLQKDWHAQVLAGYDLHLLVSYFY